LEFSKGLTWAVACDKHSSLLGPFKPDKVIGPNLVIFRQQVAEANEVIVGLHPTVDNVIKLFTAVSYEFL
jgi:hypothetical protein